MSLSISLTHLTKIFTKGKESFKAVDDVHLDIDAGELITFLGPSGCGKTTILRMIAGFEKPTEGQVLIGGRDITHLAVNKRDIGFVFQNYALFPHMSIFDNVAYGLKVRGLSRKEAELKVKEVLNLVGLIGVEERFPHQLSGGEQQRVALARVLVIDPRVLLMDEPLSNLDAKLRIYMRAEIRKIQKKLGITCIHVTHDQKEALTIADRIVVLNKGKIEQVAAPFELYANPATLFVADFIGQANILKGQVEALSEEKIDVFIYNRIVTVNYKSNCSFKIGDEVALIVRPEAVSLGQSEKSMLSGQVLSSVFVGDRIEYNIEIKSGQLVHAFVPYSHDSTIFPEGSRVGLLIDPEDVLALPL